MDKEVLKRQLTERCQQALDEALRAVDEAPDGQWIAASEWEVRDIFQQLTADCFGRMIQERIDRFVTEGDSEAFGPLLKEHARQVAFEQADECISLTDGARWIAGPARLRRRPTGPAGLSHGIGPGI